MANYEKATKEWSILPCINELWKIFHCLYTNHFCGRKKIDFIINYLFSLSCDLGEINHLHLIKCETVRPIKDCFRVLYSTWYEAVAVMKVCIWTNVTVGIIADVAVMSSTKCWTIAWAPVNCVLRTTHHALEWRQSFFVDDGQDRSTGRVTVYTTVTWIGHYRCKI